MRYVIDASVLLKAVLREQDSEAAYSLVAQHREGAATLIAPDLILTEAANALWKRALLRREISIADARDAFASLTSAGIILHASTVLLEDALALAFRHRHTVYDALYVTLAVRQRRPLVTADEKLLRAFPLPLVIPLSQLSV